jgi:desulfoferrodoxin-like iron-binding protein
MTTKIYQCENCGYLVEVVGQWGGGLTCCCGPMKFCGQGLLEAVPEKQKQRPPLDLTESMVRGKPRWQFV